LEREHVASSDIRRNRKMHRQTIGALLRLEDYQPMHQDDESEDTRRTSLGPGT